MEWGHVWRKPRSFQEVNLTVPPCLPSTAEFQKRECRGYLGVNLKFMTSARSTVAAAITQQVCQGWAEKDPGDES